MIDRIDCVVVGAGVVGLAIARALAQHGRETLIVEREQKFGTGISARNSEVVHAGIYYPHNSLKARFCVAGREALYAFCEQRHIAHRRCGKLIVATSEAQLSDLAAIRQAAEQNGVDDLRWLSGNEARILEPALSTVGALLSPSTGIIDSHAFMVSLLGEAEAHGAVIAYGAAVSGMRIEDDGVLLSFGQAPEPSLLARLVVNAAGLDAVAVARAVAGFPAEHVPRRFTAKGSYFTLSGRTPFSRLVYPVPEPGGLGVHLTLDLAGQARFGPDVEWTSHIDYDVDPSRSEGFYAAIRTYWPGLKDGQLTPAYAGIRPKISGPGEPAADFRIDGPAAHGVPGIVNLFGIESPGLTASLAIAEHVADMAEEWSGSKCFNSPNPERLTGESRYPSQGSRGGR